MMRSQGLLLHLPPGSTPGFALPLSGLGCQLTCEKLHQRVWKTLGSIQAHLCAVSAGLRWLQSCSCLGPGVAKWGQPGQGHFSVNDYTVWGKEQQSFLTFLSLFLSVCKKISTCSARSCPWLSSPCVCSLQWSSELPLKALPPCAIWDLTHPVPLPEKASTDPGTLWDAELQNLQDPCGCPCQRALLTFRSWSGHSSQHREKGTKWDLSLRILGL